PRDRAARPRRGCTAGRTSEHGSPAPRRWAGASRSPRRAASRPRAPRARSTRGTHGPWAARDGTPATRRDPGRASPSAPCGAVRSRTNTPSATRGRAHDPRSDRTAGRSYSARSGRRPSSRAPCRAHREAGPLDCVGDPLGTAPVHGTPSPRAHRPAQRRIVREAPERLLERRLATQNEPGAAELVDVRPLVVRETDTDAGDTRRETLVEGHAAARHREVGLAHQ